MKYVLCVLTDTTTRDAEGDNPAINAPTLYVSVVTLSIEDNIKLLEQLKTGFERTIKWNKHRSQMSNQAKTNNLNYLIDSTFR